MEPLAVDLREAARLTSLSVRTLSRYVHSGRLRAVRVGRRIVVPIAALNALLGEDKHGNARNESTKPIG